MCVRANVCVQECACGCVIMHFYITGSNVYINVSIDVILNSPAEDQVIQLQWEAVRQTVEKKAAERKQ